MEVATQCVSWGKSIHRPLMLATGTNSGLVRVDWVEGPLGEDFGVEPVLETPAEDGVKMEDDEPE